MVTPDYFQTFGIRIVKGRAFTDADNESSLKVAMVNEAFANRFLKGLDPLRQRVVMEQVIPGDQPQHAPSDRVANRGRVSHREEPGIARGQSGDRHAFLAGGLSHLWDRRPDHAEIRLPC